MEIKNNGIILNQDNTAGWSINLDGDLSGETYRGTYIFRCYLNPLDQLASGKAYRELLGTDIGNATESERFIAFALSQLKYRIIKAPPFWSTDSMLSGNIPDLNILSAVLEAAISAELTYKEKVASRKADAIKKASNAAEAVQTRLNESVKIE